MESRSAAIIFFYGLAWASVLTTAGDFRAFDTYSFFHGKERRKAIYRWVVSAVIVDLLPALGLWFLYRSTRIVPPDSAGAIAVVSAAIASIGVFAVPRFLHAAIATKHTYCRFYSKDDWPMVDERRRKQDQLRGHLVPGVSYIAVFWGLAWAIGWLFAP